MKVPYNWLKDYIDLTQTPEEVADCLTMAGVEVGAIELFAPVDENILVGQIDHISPHPSSENLQVVDVNCGADRKQIVCGARNIQKMDFVAVAVTGSRLPNGEAIEEVEIKGVKSQGMILSAQELGLDIVQQETGVIKIEEKCSIGDTLSDVLFLNQPVLELDLTPNRADCLGLLGVAREVSAVIGGTVKHPGLNYIEDGETIAAKVKILEPSLCFRYTAREMKDIRIAPSPLNIQLKLLSAGIRPINNIVDATNFVMWETGQPMHAFDMDKVEEQTILVRRAKKGEKLVTLDGVERQLDPNDLIIADSNNPIGLAGVMGGENTEITDATTYMLLEAASFDPESIRKTARKFNLPSDASQRFEKGVDRDGIIYAQNRAVQIMQQTSGGTISKGLIDEYPCPWQPVVIRLGGDAVEKYLGYPVDSAEVVSLLEKLGLKTTIDLNGTIQVGVPSFRQDITLDVDLIEEVARLKGYDKIPTTLPEGVITAGRPSDRKRILSKITDILVSCGLQEIITFSFMNPRMFDMLNMEPEDRRRNAVYLKNPLTEDQEIMRTTLLPNLLQVLQYNYNRQSYNQFLFEQGAVYIPSEKDNLLPEEKEMLAIAMTGYSHPEHWQHSARAVDFYYLKGILETLVTRLGITRYHWEPVQVPYLHPTQGAKLLVGGQEVGLLGALHPLLLNKFELKQDVYLAEMSLSPLYECTTLSPTFKALPRYPAVLRDAAFVVPETVSSAELLHSIQQEAGEWLEKVTLFDVYKGQQIPDSHVSLAFAFVFRHPLRTLKDHEVDAIMTDVEAVLRKNFSAALRKQ